MSHHSNDQESKEKENQETSEEDLDFQLDDPEDEIIDLVDPVEGEGAVSDDWSSDDEILEEDRELSFEDFDVEMELGEDDLSVDSENEPFEEEQVSKADSSDEMERELGEVFEGADDTSDAAAAEADDGIPEDDLVTDEALAELFASHESEVAKLLEEATGSPAEGEETPSAEPVSLSEEELPEDLFADLEMEAEVVGEEADAPEAVPVSEEELPEDLFADLGMEAEVVGEEADAPQLAAAVEDEVVTDFETELESAIDETVVDASVLAAEEGPADEVADFETELDSVIDETVVDASALAVEEEPAGEATDFEGEPEAVTQMDIPEEIAPAAAEELAALVSGQVEEVVTRLVEEQLPSIVERLVAQEIEKIKSSLESGE